MSTPSVSLAPRTRAAKRAYWQNILSEWSQDRGSIVDFCAQRHLSPKTFYRWRRRLSPDADGTRPPIIAHPGPFQPLPLAPAGEVEVFLAHGARVRLGGIAAERIVRQLLETLAC